MSEKPGDGAKGTSENFVYDIVRDHLSKKTHGGRIVTRFPPEPNGYLHIGHAKSISLNFGLARDFAKEGAQARCHLRFDDTNPTTEDIEFVESIQNDIKWLGYDWGEHLYYASDYFEKFYELAVGLIRNGLAYVDSSSEEEIRAHRGSVTEPGRPTPSRERSVEENYDLFTRMRAGEFPDGTQVLRAKLDLAAANMKMRDPLLYRIRHAHHYRTGDKWCIYPMYDFAHCISDALEGITHSICTLEFENNRELYDWLIEATGLGAKESKRPRQYEFARLNLNYFVMSKRRLIGLVEDKHVRGWDDPRMPTVAGLRRRGYRPEAIATFCEKIGVAKANSMVDMGLLEHCVRDDLNSIAPRVLAVTDPIKVVVTNFPEDGVESFTAPYFPPDVGKPGERELQFTREIWIERTDFMEEPPKKFFRLRPGGEVRLRYAYVIRCDEVVKDDSGEVVELRCTYDPESKAGKTADGRKVKGIIHWVSAAYGRRAEVRLYDRLFTEERPGADGGDPFDVINPESLTVRDDAIVEASLADLNPGDPYQFERLGFFSVDPDTTSQRPVFNRIVTLKDAWEKLTRAPQAGAKKEDRPKKTKPPAPKDRQIPVALESARQKLVKKYGIDESVALILAEQEGLQELFVAALAHHDNAQSVASWTVNEVSAALKAQPESVLGGPQLGGLVKLVDEAVVSNNAGKKVLDVLLKEGGEPEAVVERLGVAQISDPSTIGAIVDEVLAASQDTVDSYRGGKQSLFGSFVGKVMKASGGKANPSIVNEVLRQRLDS